MTTSVKHQSHRLEVTCHEKFAAKVLAPLPDGQNGVYGLGRVWQLSSTEIAIVANIRSWGSNVVDLELGNDLLVIDRLDTRKPNAVFPLNRTEILIDPDTGTSQLLSKYPLCGDFVPLGALRNDGSAHPHAGTGFGICTVRGFPLNTAGEVSTRFLGELKSDCHAMYELQQYRFDGKEFLVEHSELIPPDGLAEGWYLTNPPFGNGIHDGDDILTGIICRSADNDDGLPHIARWRRTDGRWRLADIQPVSDEHGFIEPSLIRDHNADLLYTARDYGHKEKACFTVWCSQDNGITWEKIIREVGLRAQAPLSLNMALDGTAYLASCAPRGGVFHINFRETLNLWPLSADRRHILDPSTARDCPGEFGEPKHKLWRVDHPIGMTVRLSDGAWHHLLSYRIMEEHGAEPTETTGLYVEEVLTEKWMEPPWKFAE